MAILRVNVSQRDINRASLERNKLILHLFQTYSPSLSCPVAKAIHRHKGWENARVSVSTVTYQEIQAYGIRFMSRSLPEEARDFIKDFDADREVKPFSFDLEY